MEGDNLNAQIKLTDIKVREKLIFRVNTVKNTRPPPVDNPHQLHAITRVQILPRQLLPYRQCKSILTE